MKYIYYIYWNTSTSLYLNQYLTGKEGSSLFFLIKNCSGAYHISSSQDFHDLINA